MTTPSTATRWLVAGWVVLIGGYVLVSLALPQGPERRTIGNLAQCLAPLLANAGLLLNAASSNWRKNTFWLLFALGCSMWMVGQLMWAYFELVLGQPTPNPFLGDVIFFLHVVPMIAALALRPHARLDDRELSYGFLDFSLLLLWWLFLYIYVVIPWQYVYSDDLIYGTNFNWLYLLENLVLLAGLGWLWTRTRGVWRSIYGHLLIAVFLYNVGSVAINISIDYHNYQTGSLWDVPILASFGWFGTAGIVAFRRSSHEERQPAPPQRDNPWPARLTMSAVVSLPMFAVWSQVSSHAPDKVLHFRLVVALIAMVPLNMLVFYRMYLVNQERLSHLRDSEEALENLRRLQNQFVQAEKLTSLGQLAAGAAHEINNPLTAILGYSDLLLSDGALAGRPRSLADKIRAQALRTKTLVNSLLSFARQVPAERVIIDINPILTSAVQLRSLDLRDSNVRYELEIESVLPGVRGDPNQMLQVFFNIISNAVDAMEESGGGVLRVQARRERACAVIEFSDTGPGIREPDRVFDPFYTTKAVGKGTGLGLSICYGIVKEHGGQISCSNRPEGGATFRVELPALPVHYPQATATVFAGTKAS